MLFNERYFCPRLKNILFKLYKPLLFCSINKPSPYAQHFTSVQAEGGDKNKGKLRFHPLSL